MALAISLRGLGRAYPNPLVGCVLRSTSNEIISIGHHAAYGQEHAEVASLKNVNLEVTRGAVLTVSLEPCNHFGKTPPCTDLILEKKLGHVFFISSDPNPLVSGQGIAKLHQNGVSVSKMSDFESIGEEINQQFFRQFSSEFRTHDKFMIGLKIAMTKTGIYAEPMSSKKWITGSRAREYGHCLRAFYQSIVVGSNTVLLDDPQLNIRHPQLLGVKNKKIVLDPDFSVERIVHSSRLFNDSDNPTILVVSRRNLKEAQANRLEDTEGVLIEFFEDHSTALNITRSFSIKKLFSTLSTKYKLNSFLIEGGAATWKLALDQQCVDRLHLFLSNSQEESFKDPLYFSHPILKQAHLEKQFELGEDHYEERSL